MRSSPGMMAVGGSFFDFEPFRTASRSFRGATGETSRTAPLSGHRRSSATAGRQPTPARRRRAPGRLGQPRAEPWVSRGQERSTVLHCAALGRRRADEPSTLTPSTRRVRRSTAPLSGWQAAMGASCFASGGALDQGRAVALAGLDATSCPHRFGSLVIDAAQLTRLLSAAVCSQC